jgi:hypothetical protein
MMLALGHSGVGLVVFVRLALVVLAAAEVVLAAVYLVAGVAEAALVEVYPVVGVAEGVAL